MGNVIQISTFKSQTFASNSNHLSAAEKSLILSLVRGTAAIQGRDRNELYADLLVWSGVDNLRDLGRDRLPALVQHLHKAQITALMG